MMKKKILFIVNVDWYFGLHWLDRVRYFQSIGNDVIVLTSFTSQKHVEAIESMGVSCLKMTLKRKSLNVFGEVLGWWEIYRTIKNVIPKRPEDAGFNSPEVRPSMRPLLR